MNVLNIFVHPYRTNIKIILSTPNFGTVFIVHTSTALDHVDKFKIGKKGQRLQGSARGGVMSVMGFDIFKFTFTALTSTVSNH